MAALTLMVVNYNNSMWLSDCLASINQQSLESFDLLFVDDRSTDESMDIFQQFKWRKGIRAAAIQTEKNVGVSKARILGMANVQTKFATQLDSDDFLLDCCKLTSELQIVQVSTNDIGFSQIVHVGGDGAPLASQPSAPILEGRLLLPFLYRRCMIPRDFVFSTDLYHRVGGYDPEINLYEDWDLKLRLAALVNFKYTGVRGTAYRRHGAGLSSVPPERHKEALSRVLLKNLPLYEQYLSVGDLCILANRLGLTPAASKD